MVNSFKIVKKIVEIGQAMFPRHSDQISKSQSKSENFQKN